ncbi:stalk domain-containing protein [Paenibacillus sp. FJAT-27812]|uniref:stalk domain-containing protein n=1 Tax=Paenibacillus sp. FJAT-27812 TaxID=1684143 RepID=UPI0006A7C745|nr:stalk domain-containing protein [Paenibacillus sp. FJAT-27812]
MYSKFRKVLLRAAAGVMISALMASAFAQPLMVAPNGGQSAVAYAASQSDNPIEEKIYKIVAVGDSVTAGYEFGFTEHSIPYGYVEHVYEQALFHGFRSAYSNYGVLGLKTAGLKRWMEAVAGGESVKSADIQSNLPDPRADRIFAETKQLREAITEASLIVMTIGGNDMYSVLAKLEAGADQTEAAAVRENTLASYEAELEASLRLMLSLQPKAEIVIADQYLPIPPPIKVGELFFPLYPEGDRLFLLDSVKQLRERLNLVSERLTKDGFRIRIANVASSFVGNELDFTSIAKGDIHPSRAGYAAMGKAFAKAIWNDYRVVKPRESHVPVSIVVKGKELISANKPLLVQNRTYLPLRSITDATGAAITWNAKTQTASIKLQSGTVDITAGSTTYRSNSVTKPLQAPPAFIHSSGHSSTLYVPLAAISEGLQFQVVYRDTLKTVFINK